MIEMCPKWEDIADCIHMEADEADSEWKEKLREIREANSKNNWWQRNISHISGRPHRMNIWISGALAGAGYRRK
jgi:hypothetical protein